MKSRKSLEVLILLLSVLLFGCSKGKVSPPGAKIEELMRKADRAKKEILDMQEVAARAQSAIESELGLEVDHIEWRGPPKSKREGNRSVLIFFENALQIDSEQQRRIVELSLRLFGRGVFWIVARSGERGLWRWEHTGSPSLAPDAWCRLGLVCCDWPNENEELYGTWVNAGYTDGQAKLVRSPSRWEMYDTIKDIAAHYDGTSVIKDRWFDSEGNVWYRCLQSSINIPAWYCLFKLSKTATVLEWMISYKHYPTQIDPDDIGYHIYYRYK